VPSGCTCDAGWKGDIIPSFSFPFYSGPCIPICADSKERPCACGSVTCVTNTLCVANISQCVSCPENSHVNSTYTCDCDEYYIGAIAWNSVVGGLEGSCEHVRPHTRTMEKQASAIFVGFSLLLVLCRLCFYYPKVFSCRLVSSRKKPLKPHITDEDKLGAAIVLIMRSIIAAVEEIKLEREAHMASLYGLLPWILFLALSCALWGYWTHLSRNQGRKVPAVVWVGLAATDAWSLAVIFDLISHSYALFFHTDAPRWRNQQVPMSIAHVVVSSIGLYCMSLRAIPWEHGCMEHRTAGMLDRVKRACRALLNLVMYPFWIVLPSKHRKPMETEAGRMFLRELVEFLYLFITIHVYTPLPTERIDMRMLFFALICIQLATWFLPLLLRASSSQLDAAAVPTQPSEPPTEPPTQPLKFLRQAKWIFWLTWASDLFTNLPEVVVVLLASAQGSTSIAYNAYLTFNMVIKTVALTRMIIYQPVRYRGFGASFGKIGRKCALFAEHTSGKAPSCSSPWIHSGIQGVFLALALLSSHTIVTLLLRGSAQDVASSKLALNASLAGRDALHYALAWFLVGLYEPVKKKERVLTLFGCRCGIVALVLLGLSSALALASCAVGWVPDEFQGASTLEMVSSVLVLFSVTLPGLVGVVKPVLGGQDVVEVSAEIQDNDVTNSLEGAMQMASCISAGASLLSVIQDVMVGILNLVAWSPAGIPMEVILHIKKVCFGEPMTIPAGIHVSLQWLDLIFLGLYARRREGSESYFLTSCLILKLLTWFVPSLVQAITMLKKEGHDFEKEATQAHRQMVHRCQICNVTILLRTGVDVFLRSSPNAGWMFWWTLLLWAATPVHSEDMIKPAEEKNAPEEEAPEQSNVKLQEDLRIWRGTSLALRFAAWLSQLVLLYFEWAHDEDMVWLRCSNAAIVFTTIACWRADLFVFLNVTTADDLKDGWKKYLLQISALVATSAQMVDMLFHTWIAYVSDASESGGKSVPFPDRHWSMSTATVTVLLLPELLHFHELCAKKTVGLFDSLLSNRHAGIKFLASPFYMVNSVSGLHAVIELVDVVSFVLILKSISQSGSDTTSYQYVSFLTVDVRILLYIMLVLQVLLWIMPITVCVFKPRQQESQLNNRILQFSMLVEISTDFPELLVLLAWGGWRGNGSYFVVFTMIVDLVLTFKSALYNPMRYNMCCSFQDEDEL